jgi:hypothetical protein
VHEVRDHRRRRAAELAGGQHRRCCCARATTGHTAALPSPAMNVRRFTESPRQPWPTGFPAPECRAPSRFPG